MKQSGFGVAALILGIIGMLLSCVAVGIVPCVIGLILAIIGLVQKDRKHGMAIGGLVCSVIGIGIFLLAVFVFGTLKDSGEVKEISSMTQGKDDNENSDGVEELQDSDFEISEYFYENSIGDTLYFLALKNNSDKTVAANGNVVAYDADGKTLGANSSDICALGSGHEQVMVFYFDSVSGVDHFEYTVDYKEDPYYEAVFDDVEVQETVNDGNVVITCTNNGEKAAEFIEVYALFFRGEQLVGYGSTYITDDDSELKPGKTLSKQIECYENFDSAKCYYSGRR